MNGRCCGSKKEQKTEEKTSCCGGHKHENKNECQGEHKHEHNHNHKHGDNCCCQEKKSK